MSSGKNEHFSHPVTLGAQRGTVTDYSSEFNLHFSVTLSMSVKFEDKFQYSRGLYHGSELFTI
jgi:hypothetical protein